MLLWLWFIHGLLNVDTRCNSKNLRTYWNVAKMNQSEFTVNVFWHIM